MRTRKKSQERVRDYLVREFAGTRLDSREQKWSRLLKTTEERVDIWTDGTKLQTFKHLDSSLCQAMSVLIFDLFVRSCLSVNIFDESGNT